MINFFENYLIFRKGPEDLRKCVTSSSKEISDPIKEADKLIVELKEMKSYRIESCSLITRLDVLDSLLQKIIKLKIKTDISSSELEKIQLESNLYLRFCEFYRKFQFLKRQFNELECNSNKSSECNGLKRQLRVPMQNMISLKSKIERLKAPNFPKLQQKILDTSILLFDDESVEPVKVERTELQEEAKLSFEKAVKNLPSIELNSYFFNIPSILESVKDLHKSDQERHRDTIKKLKSMVDFYKFFKGHKEVMIFAPEAMLSIGRYFKYKDTYKTNSEDAKDLIKVLDILGPFDVVCGFSDQIMSRVKKEHQLVQRKLEDFFSKVRKYKDIVTYTELLPVGGKKYLEIVFAPNFNQMYKLVYDLIDEMKAVRVDLRKRGFIGKEF